MELKNRAASMATSFFKSRDARKADATDVEPNKRAASMAASFFKSRDTRKADVTELALKYAKHFRDNGEDEIIGSNDLGRSLFNFAVASSNTTLESITRHVGVVSDILAITHYAGEPLSSGQNEFDRKVNGEGPSPLRRDGTRAVWGFTATTWNVNCPDLGELGKWLAQCRPLLEKGSLLYYPNISCSVFSDHAYTDESHLEAPTFHTPQVTERFLDLVVDNGRLSDGIKRTDLRQGTFAADKRRLLSSTLELTIPSIQGVSLHTLSKIAADEADSFAEFKGFLQGKLLEMKTAVEGPSQAAQLKKIGIELESGTRILANDLRGLQRKRAVEVTGAVLAGTAAILVGRTGHDISELLRALGASGGLWASAQAQSEYDRSKSKLEKSPFYILWLFDRN